MDATTQIERAALLEGLIATSGAKSTLQIAKELGCTWRDVIEFRSLAGVKAAFAGPGGQLFFAPEDVAKIRAAAEKYGPLKWKSIEPLDPLPPPTEEQAAFNRLAEEGQRAAQDVTGSARRY